MGCINSKKDIKDVHSNIFHVINIDNDGTELWSGKLEVTRVELTLYRKGKEPTKWPLKCLRRYGYNVDQFSFEAGRRCTTGEGIYAFRCRRAEALFYTVQAYIQGRIYSDENTNPNDPYPIPVASNGPSVAARSVSQNNTATRSSGSGGGQGQQMQCTFMMNRTGMATSQSLSPNGTIHSNSNQSRSTDTLPMEGNYLEPTPNRSNASGTGQPHTITTRFQQGLRLSSVSSGPISPDITSPGSPNSMTNILEVTTLNPLPASHTSGNVHQGVSNVYQEFPMKDSTLASLHHQHHQLLLHQHHVHHPVVAPIVTPLVGGLVRTSMDVPPLEPAPGASMLLTSSITSDITPGVGSSGPTDTLICGSVEYDQQQPSTPDAIDPARLYMNVNIGSDIGSGGTGLTTGCGKAKKPATFGSKSNSSLISISNIANNNSTNGGHNSTGSFDECQYQNVRTPTSMTAVGAAGMPLIPQNIVTGNMFAQFQRLNSVGGCPGSQFSMDPNRFYENLELAELKAVSLRGRCSKPDIFSNVDLPLDHSEPCTPTATAASQRKVNYIVLDLDQSNSSHSISAAAGSSTNGTGILSPTGTVPGGVTNGNTIPSSTTNNTNSFNNNNNNNNNNSTAINLNSVVSGGMCNSTSGMAIGSIGTGTDHRSSTVSGVSVSCSTGLCGVMPANSCGGNVPPTSLGLLPPESPKKASLGYATIDFNKTVALSNSTTPSSELDSEGSRKTRHNSTVTPLARQSNSVSD
ncbi:homeobox protein 5 [Anopheles marshallii]|uniref:homeobox protein 5 n=1 Tax=Anopheles marshallii TaxID=1521116 RepID=UPI00237C107B|nr:homeobox protein 5 [Anopheles marshallii]